MAKRRKSDQNHITGFLDLAFNLENERAKGIVEEMRKLDEEQITFQNYSLKCLQEIPKDIQEKMFIAFLLGNLWGEHKMKKALTDN